MESLQRESWKTGFKFHLNCFPYQDISIGVHPFVSSCTIWPCKGNAFKVPTFFGAFPEDNCFWCFLAKANFSHITRTLFSSLNAIIWSYWALDPKDYIFLSVCCSQSAFVRSISTNLWVNLGKYFPHLPENSFVFCVFC